MLAGRRGNNGGKATKEESERKTDRSPPPRPPLPPPLSVGSSKTNAALAEARPCKFGCGGLAHVTVIAQYFDARGNCRGHLNMDAGTRRSLFVPCSGRAQLCRVKINK